VTLGPDILAPSGAAWLAGTLSDILLSEGGDAATLQDLLVRAERAVSERFAAAVDPAGTKKVAGIHAPGAAGSPERMTLTIPGILSSRRIVLLFMGQDKLAVYNEAKAGEGSSPIRELLTQRKVPVHAFWAP
jgi:hypothetical protein